MRMLLPAVVVALAAAGAPDGLAAAEMKKVGKGEGQLDIVAWPGYIERGETDKKYDWVTDFEKKSGCKVNVKTAGTSDEMVALMNEGGFDLVTASGDASLRLIAGKRVQPINIELIKSYSTVDERLQQAPWHTVGRSITACPINGAPMCLPTTPMCSRTRRRAGRWSSRSRTCPTASRTRVGCRLSTARSTLPMRRSI